MGTKRTLVEIEHDEGYGDNLLMYLNAAIGTRDMRAVRILQPYSTELQQVVTEDIRQHCKATIELTKAMVLSSGGVMRINEIDMAVAKRAELRTYEDKNNRQFVLEAKTIG